MYKIMLLALCAILLVGCDEKSKKTISYDDGMHLLTKFYDIPQGFVEKSLEFNQNNTSITFSVTFVKE